MFERSMPASEKTVIIAIKRESDCARRSSSVGRREENEMWVS